MCSITTKNWLVQFKLDPKKRKSAHQVLFENLKTFDDSTKWTSNIFEERLVQFVEYSSFVIARLNVEPSNVICQKIENTFKLGDEIQLAVKLCRTVEKKKKFVDGAIIEMDGHVRSPEESEAFAKRLLEKAGLDILGCTTNTTENICFFKNRKRVLLKTFEAHAVCKITDINAFEQAWRIGVGKRKTWGLGMLRVKQHESKNVQ